MIQISRITLLVITNLILILILIAGAFYSFNKTSEKAAFVNSSKVLSQFMGMKETQEVYQKKVAAWQSKLDTLQQKIIERENALEELAPSLAPLVVSLAIPRYAPFGGSSCPHSIRPKRLIHIVVYYTHIVSEPVVGGGGWSKRSLHSPD